MEFYFLSPNILKILSFQDAINIFKVINDIFYTPFLRLGLWSLVCVLNLYHIETWTLRVSITPQACVAIGSRAGQYSSIGLILRHSWASHSSLVSPSGFCSRVNPPVSLYSNFQLPNPFLWRLWNPFTGTRDANTGWWGSEPSDGRKGGLRGPEPAPHPRPLDSLLPAFSKALLTSHPGAGPPLPTGRSKSMWKNCTLWETHTWSEDFLFFSLIGSKRMNQNYKTGHMFPGAGLWIIWIS